MSRRLRRECRDYERRWRDTCVDKNLEDEWLERLNDLETLALVGICEGHPDRRAGSSGRYPHIALRLKESLLPGIAGRWGELRVALLNEIGRLFESGDTDARLELKFRLRAGRGKLGYQEDLTLRLRSLCSYRQALVRQRTQVKNRIHSILHRNLVPTPHLSDLFGVKGLKFLQEVALPDPERFQMD